MFFKELRSDFGKGFFYVGTDVFGRFIGDFDIVLEDIDREVFGGYGVEEESEVFVDFVRFFRYIFDYVFYG